MIPVMLKHCKLSYIPSASGKNTKIEKVRVNATKKKKQTGPAEIPRDIFQISVYFTN